MNVCVRVYYYNFIIVEVIRHFRGIQILKKIVCNLFQPYFFNKIDFLRKSEKTT